MKIHKDELIFDCIEDWIRKLDDLELVTYGCQSLQAISDGQQVLLERLLGAVDEALTIRDQMLVVMYGESS